MKNRALFEEYAADILAHDLFRETRNLCAHGTISIYDHSVAVAELAFAMAEDDPRIDKRTMVRAGLLHDFVLYEWHVPGLRYLKHGWVHPAIAARKAQEVFQITPHEAACIQTHMWPWTLFHIPKTRDAWALSLADKLVAAKEATLTRGKRRRTTPLPLPQKSPIL
jgi:uncharacterized protein